MFSYAALPPPCFTSAQKRTPPQHRTNGANRTDLPDAAHTLNAAIPPGDDLPNRYRSSLS
jgi:hypothetical protein